MFGKVSPGQPLKFPAALYNRLAEIANTTGSISAKPIQSVPDAETVYSGAFAVEALGNNQYKVYNAGNPESQYAGETDVAGCIQIPVTTVTLPSSAWTQIKLCFHFNSATSVYTADFSATGAFATVTLATVQNDSVVYQAFNGTVIRLAPTWVM